MQIFKSLDFFSFGFIIFFYSCYSTNKEIIVKKWKLINTNLPIPDSAKQRMYNDFLIEFTKSKKYFAGFKDLQDVGTYTFTGSEKSMMITDNKTKDIAEIIITKLTSDTLKTRSKSKGFESVFVSVR